MTPNALGDMEILRPIEFTDALAWLQGAIGCEVRVSLNHHGHFFGCGIQGTLRRVYTLPPDNSAISIVVAKGEGLFLDPEDVAAFIGGREGNGQWLEFQTGFGPAVSVEVVGEADD